MKRKTAVMIACFCSIIIAINAQAENTKNKVIHHTQVQILKAPDDVTAAKQQLSDLGYWVGPVNGKSDNYLRQSLIAFEKVEGRARTGKLTADELEALRGAKRPEPHETNGRHIEIDLHRQVLFIVDDKGVVSSILPVSTGSGKMFTEHGAKHRAVTPTGDFKIYRKIRAMHKSPLGLLYYPNYVVDGIAIHGNGFVPAYPASHGCIRIPMYAAVQFTNQEPIGTAVDIYNSDAVIQTGR